MQRACLQENTSTSRTVILQPQSLRGDAGQDFQQSLENAMNHAPTVIVDLLWVESIESDELHVLAQALLRSQKQGKDLTFLGLEHKIQVEIERRIELDQRREKKESYSFFAPEFEAFLDRHRDAKASEALV
jgi:anti-anti-sigma regulatory factor